MPVCHDSYVMCDLTTCDTFSCLRPCAKDLGPVLGPLHPIVGENLAMIKAVSKLVGCFTYDWYIRPYTTVFGGISLVF